MGDNRRMDGRFIRVKMATFGWRQRRSNKTHNVGSYPTDDSFVKKSMERQPSCSLQPLKFRDHRTYREVLIGDKRKEVVEDKTGANKFDLDRRRLETKGMLSSCEGTTVSFDTMIPEEEVAWLKSAIICDTKDPCTAHIISRIIEEMRVKVKICQMSSCRFCLVFLSVDRRDAFLDKVRSLQPQYLEALKRWEEVGPHRNYENRLDVARILVRVKSIFDVPAQITVNVKRTSCTLSVMVEGSIAGVWDSGECAACSPAHSKGNDASSSSEHRQICQEVEKFNLVVYGKGVENSCSQLEFSQNLTETELRAGGDWARGHQGCGPGGPTFDLECTRKEGSLGLLDTIGLNYSDNWALQMIIPVTLNEEDGLNTQLVSSKEWPTECQEDIHSLNGGEMTIFAGGKTQKELYLMIQFLILTSAIGMRYFFEKLQRHLRVTVNANGNSSGLLLGWEEGYFEMESKIEGERFMLVVGIIKHINLRCGIGTVYAPNDDDDRALFWEELVVTLNSVGVSWCLGGDFNVVRRAEEKLGANYNYNAMEAFSDFMENQGLVDLPMVGGRFTWQNNLSPPTRCRVDRFLVDPIFITKFERIKQMIQPKSISDHNPITLYVEAIN
ncbi:hypothetical protein PTKIN_Ptkin18bG0078900 [Pterospermum kingtungense]